MHFSINEMYKNYVTLNIYIGSPHMTPQGIYAPSNSCCKIVNQPHPRPPRLEKITDTYLSIHT